MHAVGMLPESLLAAAIAALSVDTLARDQVVDAFSKMVPRNGEIIARVGGDPLRIWRDDDGQSHVEPYVEPKPTGPKPGRGAAKRSATVLAMVRKDPAATSAVKEAADKAEARARRKPATDEIDGGALSQAEQDLAAFKAGQGAAPADSETDEPVE